LPFQFFLRGGFSSSDGGYTKEGVHQPAKYKGEYFGSDQLVEGLVREVRTPAAIGIPLRVSISDRCQLTCRTGFVRVSCRVCNGWAHGRMLQVVIHEDMSVRELAESITLLLDHEYDYSNMFKPSGLVPEQSPGQGQYEMQPRVVGLYAEARPNEKGKKGGSDVFVPLSAIIKNPALCKQ
jgi:hypothetical protein